MESVTFSQFVNNPRFRRAVKAGKSFLITEYGKLYFRVLTPERGVTHEGAGRHLFQSKAVSPEQVPNEEWGAKE